MPRLFTALEYFFVRFGRANKVLLGLIVIGQVKVGDPDHIQENRVLGI